MFVRACVLTARVWAQVVRSLKYQDIVEAPVRSLSLSVSLALPLRVLIQHVCLG